MKKTLVVLLVIVMLFTFCSCGAKSLDDAVASLEEADYYVVTKPMDYFGFEDAEGNAFCAFEKEGVDEGEYSDLDGDALYQAKNVVWAFYFANEEKANERYEEVKKFADMYNEIMEELLEDEEEAAADGIVPKIFLCEKEGANIYMGTEEAIKLVK